MGLYWPMLPPTYQKKNNSNNMIDYTNVMKEEFWRQCIRKGMGNSLI
jgi:hypothetical protein